MKRQAVALGLALLAACDKGDPTRTPVADVQFSVPSPEKIAHDPASPLAARDRVGLYYKLIADKRLDAAQAMWAEGQIRKESPALFAARFAGEEKVRAEVGQPSDPVGAGGESYITVPAIIRGVPELAPDRPYELHRLVILRRSGAIGASTSKPPWQIDEVRDVAAEPEGTARPIAF